MAGEAVTITSSKLSGKSGHWEEQQGNKNNKKNIVQGKRH